jgi:hypothetical protein
MMSNSKENMTLRERVTEKLSQSEAGIAVTFSPLEAKYAGFFVEDALTVEDVEGSNDEENI